MQDILGPEIPEDDFTVQPAGHHDGVGNLDEHTRYRLRVGNIFHAVITSSSRSRPCRCV